MKIYLLMLLMSVIVMLAHLSDRRGVPEQDGI
jgi:hypothetical protein